MSRSAAETHSAASTQCPVAALALETQQMVDAMDAADLAKQATPPDDTATRHQYEERRSALFDLISFRKEQAVTTAANSADGALHQLAIASAIVAELYELTPEATDNHQDWRRARDLNGLFQWAVYSVAGVLERASAEPRERLGVEIYMPRHLDPFQVTAMAGSRDSFHTSSSYSSYDAEGDSGNLAVLLDMLVDEECGLVRTGMSSAQAQALNRIGALAWTARDLARRISADLNGTALGPAHELGGQHHDRTGE